MRFFTESDLLHAVAAMLAHSGLQNPQLLGKMSGIKRRARARAVIEFALQLDPPPPDCSITTMRDVLQDLFGRAVSNNQLLERFATPGRKADDRVDMTLLTEWLESHRPRLERDASRLISALNEEWPEFTHMAASRVGELRRRTLGSAAQAE